MQDKYNYYQKIKPETLTRRKNNVFSGQEMKFQRHFLLDILVWHEVWRHHGNNLFT